MSAVWPGPDYHHLITNIVWREARGSLAQATHTGSSVAAELT